MNAELNRMEDLPTRALSVRQPWATLLAAGIKDVENRTRRVRFRGRFLIHASQVEDFDSWDVFTMQTGIHRHDRRVPECFDERMVPGGIVGVAELVDCVEASDSPWFTGPYGWVVANARRLQFVPCRGLLGFWPCDYHRLSEETGV